MIVGFAARMGIKADAEEVIEYLENIDDEEVDVEMTADMLGSVSGGGKCGCQEESPDEPWGRCPGMRPMRKWLFGGVSEA